MVSRLYKIADNYIDLSRVKTVKIAKRFSNDKEKKILVIINNDRIEFVFNPDGNGTEKVILNDHIEIPFENENEASAQLDTFIIFWERYLKSKE